MRACVPRSHHRELILSAELAPSLLPVRHRPLLDFGILQGAEAPIRPRSSIARRDAQVSEADAARLREQIEDPTTADVNAVERIQATSQIIQVLESLRKLTGSRLRMRS